MNRYTYIIDENKFFDRQIPNVLIKEETLRIRLLTDDDKFATKAQVDDYLGELKATGITRDQLKQSKKAEKEPVNLHTVYEELFPLLPLKLKTTSNGQSQIFFVSENNEIAPIDYTDDTTLVHALVHRTDTWAAIREYYNTTPLLDKVRDKLTLGNFVIKMLKDFWLYDERAVFHEQPKQISWDYDTLAYKKMNPQELVAGPTPTWDEFTSRLDYPEVFKAWVWSIFEPKNNLRQIMWLKGAGNDGKSSVQKALESVLGSDYCYSMKPGDETQQWFQRNVFGKVLVNYADCRNVYLVGDNSIKQLTGGDTTSIEGKGVNSFTGKIYSKLLVTSNYSPKINPELQAHTSRLIKIEVAAQADNKKDSQFEVRLQNEIYAFLHSCQQHFEELVSPGYEKLVLPKELEQKIKIDCASETFLNLQDFVQDHIVFDAEAICKPGELKIKLKDYLLEEKRVSGDQVKFYQTELEAKLSLNNCFQTRIGDNGRQTTMWLGFRLKTKEELLRPTAQPGLST